MCSVRGNLQGIVNDNSTFLLDQIAAAGIFSNAESLVRAVAYASNGLQSEGVVVKNYLDTNTLGVSSGYGLGFDILGHDFTDYPEINKKALYFSGFTGGHITSIPEKDVHIAVLTNVKTVNGLRVGGAEQTRLLVNFRKEITNEVFKHLNKKLAFG